MADITKSKIQFTKWKCTAPIPKGDKRVPCNTDNEDHLKRCSSCQAPRDFNLNKNNSNTKGNTMSTVKPVTATTSTANKTDAKPTKAEPAKTGAAATTEAPAAGAPTAASPVKPDPSDPASYKGLPRLKFYSTKEGCTDYCARVLPVFVEKYGAPKDPWGNVMTLRGGQAGPLKKEQRAAAKEAEKERIAKMSDEEKLTYAKAKREERAKVKADDAARKKQMLMDELRKELEAKGLSIVPKEAVKA